MDIRLRADVNGGTFADAPDEALDDLGGDLLFRQTHDGLAAEERLDVFRGVGDETGCAIVPATAFDEHAALDLTRSLPFVSPCGSRPGVIYPGRSDVPVFDERLARDVSEVCAPFALCMKDEFTFLFRAAHRRWRASRSRAAVRRIR